MENNSTSKQRRNDSLLSARIRLNCERRAAGSYRLLAEKLGIKHHVYISNFVKHGIIPNKDAQKKMGIYQRSKGAIRYQASNARAKAKGWKNWNEFQEAVNEGEAEIPHTKLTTIYSRSPAQSPQYMGAF